MGRNNNIKRSVGGGWLKNLRFLPDEAIMSTANKRVGLKFIHVPK